MDEVDGIILSQLRTIGTNLDDDINSLAGLSTDALVEGCARCINTINGDDKLKTKMPKAMSARFRVGTDLANGLKALGYGSDVGYNSFLYSNENDSRAILMWLVERLPKESTERAAADLDANALLLLEVGRELTHRQNSLWTPPHCKVDGVAWRGDKANKWHVEGTASMAPFAAVATVTPQSSKSSELSAAKKQYYAADLPLLTAQPPLSRTLVASILESTTGELAQQQWWEREWNSKGIKSGLSEADYRAKKTKGIAHQMANQLRKAMIKSEAEGKREEDMLHFLDDFADADRGKASKFKNQEAVLHTTEEVDPNAPKPPTEAELADQRDAELADLRGSLTDVTDKLKELKEAILGFNQGLEQMDAEADALDDENARREEEYKTRKKVLDLLPDADNNIAKLNQVVESSTKRILALAGKWEVRRNELLDTYRKLRRSQGDAEDHAKQQLAKIKELRGEMKEIADGVKEKDMTIKQLNTDLEGLQDQIGRSSYTRRIMELVRNISKQKEDIGKVLQDTRVIQKDISQLTEKISRIYQETDDTIFTNAKKDEGSRKVYKLLATLHETCENIVKTVDGTGQILREVRELDEQIEGEEKKNMAENLARISADLKAMKKENAGMIAQLKA